MSTTLDQLSRRVADLEYRLNLLTVGGSGGGGNTTQYGPNVLSNGGFESGTTGWFPAGWIGTQATLAIETVSPLDGLDSLKLAEVASSSTRVGYLPSGNVSAPTIGVDVFPTAAGDTWLLSALCQASAAITHARLYGFCGATPSDCYGLVGANTDWVQAVDIPLTAATPSLLQGTLVVPAGRSYITFSASLGDFGNTATVPGSAWSWLMDNVSLQQKLV